MILKNIIVKNEIDDSRLKNVMYHTLCDIKKLEEYGVKALFCIFQNEGVFDVLNKKYSIFDVINIINPHPLYYSLIQEIIRLFIKFNLVVQSEVELYQSLVPYEGYVDIGQVLLDCNTQLADSAKMLMGTLNHYIPLIRKEYNYLSIMFDQGNLSYIDNIYTNNADALYYNELLAKALLLSLENNHSCNNLKILEIGGGVGATTEKVLEALQKSNGDYNYTFTDISQVFIDYAMLKFSEYASKMQFLKYDICEDPVVQGYKINTYDIIIATNVLHVSNDILASVGSCYDLLKKNGLLIINEGIAKSDYSTLTYGLTDGWWNSQDSEWSMQGAPVIGLKQWLEILNIKQFTEVISLNEIIAHEFEVLQDVIIAKK